jgi:hypothetical protein
MAPVVRRQSALRGGQRRQDEWMGWILLLAVGVAMGETAACGAEAGGVILFFVVLASPRKWALRATQAPPPNGNENENERPGLQCRTPIQHILPPYLASYKSLLHSPPSPFFDTPVCLPAHLHYTFNSVPHRPSPPRRPTMLAPPQGPVEHSPTDPLVLYSRSLREYTLQLWMESRKQAEERVRARTHKKHHGAAKAPPPKSSCKQPVDGESPSSTSNEASTPPSQGLPA